MSDIVITVEQVSKKYQLGRTKAKDLRTSISQFFNRRIGKNTNDELFWALKDVSFEVKRGDILGIIGRNGAGKSTLLKILSRITEPSKGRIILEGRVASLLEVGTGFHPELTGRENIFLNGAILGMKKQEIKNKFDEIVDFSGVERFLDTPVKRYSSGMYVRLAFSVAAHLNQEILLIDEVLSVGDAEFRKKCLGKMNHVANDGRTVIFVSHNMGAIKQLCPTGLLLNEGQIVKSGDMNEVIDAYLQTPDDAKRGMIVWSEESAPGTMPFKLFKAILKNEKNEIRTIFSSNQSIQVELEYHLYEEVRGMRFVLQIWTDDGQILFASYSGNQDTQFIKTKGRYTSRVNIPPNLFNNRVYKVVLSVGVPKQQNFLRKHLLMSFSVERTEDFNSNNKNKWPGIINPICKWEV